MITLQISQADVRQAGPMAASQEFIQHRLETYGDRVTVTDSLVGNVTTTSITFADDATKAAYYADPIVVAHRESIIAYNKANGIVVTSTNE